MRGLMIAAAVFAASAAPAQAQTGGDLSGTWAFQTQSYGTEQVGAVMSGAAVFTASGPNHYDIRLLTHELLVNRDTGQSRLLTARQNCTGVAEDGQINVTCTLAEAVEGYEADNFVLQTGETDQLVGVLSSATSAQITFSRMR